MRQAESAGEHGIDMKQGKKTQNGLALFESKGLGDAVNIRQHILVGQQHAFGVSGGSGSIKNIGDVLDPAGADNRTMHRRSAAISETKCDRVAEWRRLQ